MQVAPRSASVRATAHVRLAAMPLSWVWLTASLSLDADGESGAWFFNLREIRERHGAGALALISPGKRDTQSEDAQSAPVLRAICAR